MKSAVIVLFALACGCVSKDLTTGPTTGGRVLVVGRVMDFVRDVPVVRAPVGFGSYGTFTDTSGVYRLEIPSGYYDVYATNVWVGNLLAIDPVLRGDLFVQGGGCTAAYGMIVERWSRRPVAGAKVTLVGFETLTDSTGWYRLNMGCNLSYGTGTTFLRVSRAGYVDYQFPAGRREGLGGIRRLDLDLEPQ